MKRYDIELADGKLPDPDSRGTTMSYDATAICSEGHTPLIRSSRKVICSQCGVWWWWSRGEVNGRQGERNLAGVHPDLQAVIRAAAGRTSFIVTEGVRTQQRQTELLADGKSQTSNSRHLTGHAVDIAVKKDGVVTWEFSEYARAADTIKRTAKERGIPIKWGGDWAGFKDGTHFQLTWDAYPLAAKPKTASNSKTIGVAGVGLPLATLLPELVNVKNNVSSLLGDYGGQIVQWAQIALIIGMGLYIVWERKKKIDQEGV